MDKSGKTNLQSARVEAQNEANTFDTDACIYVYNSKGGDCEGHQLVVLNVEKGEENWTEELDFVERISPSSPTKKT